MVNFVVCRKKNKVGKDYIALFADIGYKKMLLCYKDSVIAEICDCKLSQLYNLDLDVEYSVNDVIQLFA